MQEKDLTRRQWMGTTAAAAVTLPFIRTVAAAADNQKATARKLTTGAPQIFIDDRDVANMDNIKRLFHDAEKFDGNPVIFPQQGKFPWDRAGGGPAASFIYDEEEKIFKCWFQGVIGDEEPDPRGGFKGYGPHTLNYATSEDGMNWVKPNLGLHEVLGSKDNNIVIPPTYHNGKDHWESVRKDPFDPDDSRRYKGFGWSSETGGLHSMWSPDGLNWSHSPGHVVPGGDAQSMMIDTLKKRYVAFVRGGAPTGVHTSDDFNTWSERDNGAINWKYPGSCYNMVGFVYGDTYLGWVSWFHAARDDPRFPNLDLHLLKSADGLHFDMVDQSMPVVPCGTYGEWDRYMTMLTGAPPIAVGKELFVYYRGFSRRHKPFGLPEFKDTIETGALGLAKLRLDGFSSLAAGFDGGKVTTKPFVCPGGTLNVNAKADYHARVAVEVLDRNGNTIKGFTVPDCIAVESDDVLAPVRWQSKQNLDELKGREISLRFQIVNARLYAYRIG